MNAILAKLYQDIRGSYWFVPALMVLGAIVLAAMAGRVDSVLHGGWVYDLPLIATVQEDDLRAVLATLAGSMITVAGVTFSMTVMSVTFASAQFGPRLVGNFMRDRGNQITLGTFIATFAYCTTILATVGVAGENAVATLPRVSFLIALLMGFGSVAVLIYFIHHVPETLNIGNITSSLGRELLGSIDSLFPVDIGERKDPEAPPPGGADTGAPPHRLDRAAAIAGGDGYIQAIDGGSLMKIATRGDLSIDIECRPGFFSTEGKVLAHAWPAHRVDAATRTALRRCFALGSARTATQDTLFLVDELIEIVGRALSPGVCDPFTAMNCIDWLESALGKCADRDDPPGDRYDEAGVLRVRASPVTFEKLVDTVFAKSIQYVAADANAARHTMRMIADVAVATDRKDRRAVLAAHADALAGAADSALPLPAQRDEFRRIHKRVRLILETAPKGYGKRDAEGWLDVREPATVPHRGDGP
mgnify:CR=1 FL=1